MTAPILAFTDYTKPFLLETNASKDGLGVVLLQKQTDGQYHPIAYCSRALTPHKKNYHSPKLEFLALKWAVMEHFKDYLPCQTFLVRIDNNPLTYIMSTPNLDATGHQWVGALAQFNFELEYQNWCDNIVVNVLRQVTTWLGPDTVKSILNGVAVGAVHHAKVHDPAVVEDRILWFIRVPYTYAQCPKARLKFSCSSWSQSPLCSHFEWVPLRCRTSRAWPYLVFVVGVLLVARYGQPNAPIYQVLHPLLADWWTLVQSSPTSNCGHCSDGPFACGLYQHRNDHGAE